ncbi:VIT domain-containing protein [Stieleria sp. TO1_6]|uniref:VIT domain-containing protein n=1 Tax=Stieleria tagensis TaxID=2956795 RepID=UPI00209B1DFC|nr:VIT domain-containing protein [Stieleria tagensis]MCO8125026.1 VIT domain-containing protein [Stieleria tagensis]
MCTAPTDSTPAAANPSLYTLFCSLASLICFATAGQAGYTVLSGAPVTQGQMQIAEDDLQRLNPAQPPSGRCFTLKETRVQADISGVLARVRVSQTFQNPYSDRLEAQYIFPLPEDSAVDAYSFQIGERVIVGEVKRKQEARREYEQARDQGRKAALLEQERANVFSQGVANIPPHGEVTVHIEYVHPLEIDQDRYLFRFPMVVGPRYIPGQSVGRPNVGRGWADDTDQVPDASRITPHFLPEGQRNGNDVFISLNIDAGMPIQELVPVTHQMEIHNQSETQASVSLKNQSTIADKDFVIEYRLAADDSMLASLAHRETEQSDGYVMLALQPKWSIEPTEITPREVVLVLDTSGSMNGPAISQLRLFADQVLENLNPQDEFRIIAFSNQPRAFQTQPLAVNAANVQAGKQFVRSLHAGGGTNLLSALQLALPVVDDESARPRYLVLMTDALVGNDDSILGYLQQPQFQDTRVFPIAFGAAPNHYIIGRAAELGRGFAMQVTNQDNAPAIAKRFNEQTNSPYMTDLQIDWGGLVINDQIPSKLPDLYAGKPLLVLGRYDTVGSGTVTLRGNVLEQSVQMQLDLELPQQQSEHDAIAPVWARQRIRQIWNRDVGKQTPEGRDEITALGLTHQLMTHYTSFVAVEKELAEPAVGKMITQDVSVLMPEGMSEQGVGRSRAGNRTHSVRSTPAGTPTQSDAASAPSQFDAPAPVSAPASTYQAPSGGGGRTSSGSGGGAIGPFTALFSIGGLGAAAMSRRRRKNGRAGTAR